MAAVSGFHPILMTTITTITRVTPLIVSADPLFNSLAVGTVPTQSVVAVLYTLFFRVKSPVN